jgi:hypothetical protein
MIQHISIAGRSLIHAQALTTGHQRLDSIKEEIVKFRPGLAVNLNRILESGSGDQGYPAAFALQHCVRADGRSVKQRQRSAHSNLSQSLSNRTGGIVGRGEYFEYANPAALHPNAVGEGAAGIDCDASGSRWSTPFHAGGNRTLG